MKKLKVVTVVGTRPEIIRLSRVIPACDRYFDHVLVHTGQNWDFRLNEIFFRELEIRKPDHFLESPGRHLGETIGNIVSRSYELLARLRPDALLVLGDTNSALCAIPAKRLKIPIFHMEAGNRCFDQNVPEEINRKIVDHISDVNLPYTEHSRRYLLSEGIRKEHVFVTGSPMAEVLDHYGKGIERSRVLAAQGLKKGGYLLVSAHREENLDIDENLESLVDSLDAIAREFRRPVIYSTHPRARLRLQRKRVRFHPLVRSVKPFGFLDYNQLQRNAFCVLSDSGTLSEESAMLRRGGHRPGLGGPGRPDGPPDVRRGASPAAPGRLPGPERLGQGGEDHRELRQAHRPVRVDEARPAPAFATRMSAASTSSRHPSRSKWARQ
jgi:UDP-N-acetylglucosamine 2-epimerase